MQTQKMSLASIKGKLSRAEMKNIMAGSGADKPCSKCCTTAAGTDCTSCQTGTSCNNDAFLIACAQTSTGACA
jgi:hypothetical protein